MFGYRQIADAGENQNVKELALNGWTALHYDCNDLELMKWLVEDQGLEINAKGSQAETPLHIAASFDHLNVVQWLMAKSTDVNAMTTWGETPKVAAKKSYPFAQRTTQWLEEWIK